MEKVKPVENRDRLFRLALSLAIVTVVYNIAEGLISAWFGIKDETLTLFGFGMDSFVETISALGITQMIIRIRSHPNSERGRFEVRALKVTGWCFYALGVILTVSAIYNLIHDRQPVSTTAGVIIAVISILSMWALIRAKTYVGKKLGSAPIITDARCNLVCLYMSLVLLAASGLWYLFHIPYIDLAGTAGLVYFSVKEGKEAFERAKGLDKCEV